jgi:membrane protein
MLRETWNRWIADGAFQLSAALAYYSVFAIAPALIIVMFFAGLVSSGNSVEQLQSQISEYVDAQTAGIITRAVVHTREQLTGGFIYAAFALLMMAIGASAFFYQLQAAVNNIWGIPPRADVGIGRMIKDRFGAFMLVVGIGILLQTSVLVSSVIAIYRAHVKSIIPQADVIWYWTDTIILFAVVTVLFAMIFKWLPDADVDWHDVWIGSLLTAGLFALGKWGIALYLAHSSFYSVYGAAGSLIGLLVWVYYSSLIMLFGAEFTEVYAEQRGRQIRPRAA